jgi:hypothetical protein
MAAPLESFTASPTVNEGAGGAVVAPAVALVFEPEPDAAGVDVPGAEGGVAGVVVDWVGGLALVDGGGADVGALGGSLAGAAGEPPA